MLPVTICVEKGDNGMVYECLLMITETRDGKRSYDPAPHSKEMQKLNKAFGKAHGCSSLLNLIAMIATIWYGVSLAEMLA